MNSVLALPRTVAFRRVVYNGKADVTPTAVDLIFLFAIAEQATTSVPLMTALTAITSSLLTLLGTFLVIQQRKRQDTRDMARWLVRESRSIASGEIEATEEENHELRLKLREMEEDVATALRMVEQCEHHRVQDREEIGELRYRIGELESQLRQR